MMVCQVKKNSKAIMSLKMLIKLSQITHLRGQAHLDKRRGYKTLNSNRVNLERQALKRNQN